MTTRLTKLLVAGMYLALLTACATETSDNTEKEVEIPVPSHEESFEGISGADINNPDPGFDLATMPTADEEVPAMDALIAELAHIIDSITPVGPWEYLRFNDRVTCDAPENVDKAATIGLRHYVATTSVPADKLEQVQQALFDRAAKDGFTYEGAYANEPGNWDITLRHPDGRTLNLADGGNVLLTGNTGCRRDTFEGDRYQYRPELRPENRAEETPGR